MVGINGEVIAEPNDPNTVKVSGTATNGLLLFGRGSKLTRTWGPAGIVTLGSAGTPVAVTLTANSYLCTDANGNLIFKEL